MTSFTYRQLPPPPDDGPETEPEPGVERARLIGTASISMVGLGALLIAGRAVSIHMPPCPFRALTGIPCPGCGMTRLADAVAHGRFHQALGADVAGVAILATLMVLATTYLVRVIIQKVDTPRWMRSPLLLVGIGALVLVHWGTTVVTGGLPST
jgi:hypothetical protein